MAKSHQNRASFRAIGNVLRPLRGWISNSNNNSNNDNTNINGNQHRIVHHNQLLGNGTISHNYHNHHHHQQSGVMSPDDSIIANNQIQHQETASVAGGNYTTEDIDCGGFKRSTRARMSLPIVQSKTKSHDASLGFVYLQFRTETKRANLPNEITALDTVQALFVRSFPNQLTMNFFSSPDIKIYIHETERNVFYELQDVRDVKNQSVLRIYQRDSRNGLFQPLLNLPTTAVAIQKQQFQQQQQQHQAIMSDNMNIYQRSAIVTPGSREPLYASNDGLLVQNHYRPHQIIPHQQQYSGKPPMPLPPFQQSTASNSLHQIYGTVPSIIQNGQNGYNHQTGQQHLNLDQQTSLRTSNIPSRIHGTFSMNDAMGRPMSSTLPHGAHLLPIYGTHQASINTVTVPPPKPQRMMHFNSINRLNGQAILSRNESLSGVSTMQQEQMNGTTIVSNSSIPRSITSNYISRPLPERPYSVNGPPPPQERSFQSIDRVADFSSISQNSHPRQDTTPSNSSNCNQSIYCSSASNATNSLSDSNGNSHTNNNSNNNNNNSNDSNRTSNVSRKARPEPVVDEEARQRVMQLEQKLDNLTDLVQSILSLHRSRSLSVQP